MIANGMKVVELQGEARTSYLERRRASAGSG